MFAITYRFGNWKAGKTAVALADNLESAVSYIGKLYDRSTREQVQLTYAAEVPTVDWAAISSVNM